MRDRRWKSAGDDNVGSSYYFVQRNGRYDASRLATHRWLGSATLNVRNTWQYDARLRVTGTRLSRAATPGAPPSEPGSLGSDALWERYVWDEASNLVQVKDLRQGTATPDGYRPRWIEVEHDALCRVAHAAYSYRQDGGAYTASDLGTDWRDERVFHGPADPMREEPAAMAPAQPAGRVVDLVYEHDWLANQVEHTDDAGAFYERELGPAGQVVSGYEAGQRPAALYLATNLPQSPPAYAPGTDRGGWLELDYGASGHLESLTVHGRCADAGAVSTCYDDGSLSTGGPSSGRRGHLRQSCACAREQHYQYRWDEVGRLSEARRYDRAGSGDWDLEVRQRYRYDATNRRVVEQTLDDEPSGTDPEERIHLYVYPGDLERSGLRRPPGGGQYDADAALGTETQYLVGPARVVWKSGAPGAPYGYAFDADFRIAAGVTDLIGTVAGTVDLYSGELLELSTYYPTGAQETHWTQRDDPAQPEPLGFTGKEADSEVGVVYFGERYLVPRIGRWASPDPLHVHALGGGEALNGYHYVGGSLLQGRDPVGLDAVDDAPAVNAEGQTVESGRVFAVDPDASFLDPAGRRDPPPMTREQLNAAAAAGAHLYRHDPEAPLTLEQALRINTANSGAAAAFARLMANLGGVSAPDSQHGDPNGVAGGRCPTCAPNERLMVTAGVLGAALMLAPFALEAGAATRPAAQTSNLGRVADDLTLAAADDLARVGEEAVGLAAGGAARTPGTAIQTYWPPNRGFAGTPSSTTLGVGTRIDRYGSELETLGSEDAACERMYELLSAHFRW